jgi:hypothetical protein
MNKDEAMAVAAKKGDATLSEAVQAMDVLFDCVNQGIRDLELFRAGVAAMNAMGEFGDPDMRWVARRSMHGRRFRLYQADEAEIRFIETRYQPVGVGETAKAAVEDFRKRQEVPF